MTPALEAFSRMNGIATAANGRPFTASQKKDFMQAYRSIAEGAMGDVSAIKSLAQRADEFELGDGHPRDLLYALKTYLATPINRQVMPDDGIIRNGFDRDTGEFRSNGEWGRAVVEHALGGSGFKAFLASGTVPVTVPLNPQIAHIPSRPRSLREILPSRNNESGQFAYLQQTVRTNLAAPVAHGALKPTSVLTTERVDAAVRTIAHLSEPINRQDLADAPLLAQFVEQEMFTGLMLALDGQILTGDGIAPNLPGFDATSGIQTVTVGADALVRLRSAITLIQSSDLVPAVFVISPSDYAKVETVAMASFAANSNVSPFELFQQQPFGLPALVTTAATNGTAWLLGRDVAYLEIRQDATIDWTDAAYVAGPPISSAFERNQLIFRAEMRVGLAVTQPAGIVKITIA